MTYEQIQIAKARYRVIMKRYLRLHGYSVDALTSTADLERITNFIILEED